MKASELDKGLRIKDPSSTNDDDERVYYIPPYQVPVVKEFERVSQFYERSISDRVWDNFVSLVTSDPVASQEIQIRIPQIYQSIPEPEPSPIFLSIGINAGAG
jgi:hypothetical protein